MTKKKSFVFFSCRCCAYLKNAYLCTTTTRNNSATTNARKGKPKGRTMETATATTANAATTPVEIDREKLAQQAEKDIAAIRESLQPYGEDED